MNIHALLEEFILLKFPRIPALAKLLDSFMLHQYLSQAIK